MFCLGVTSLKGTFLCSLRRFATSVHSCSFLTAAGTSRNLSITDAGGPFPQTLVLRNSKTRHRDEGGHALPCGGSMNEEGWESSVHIKSFKDGMARAESRSSWTQGCVLAQDIPTTHTLSLLCVCISWCPQA